MCGPGERLPCLLFVWCWPPVDRSLDLEVGGVLDMWESDLNFPLSRDEDLCWIEGFWSCAYFAAVVSVLNVFTSMAENVSPKPRWAGSFFLSLS